MLLTWYIFRDLRAPMKTDTDATKVAKIHCCLCSSNHEAFVVSLRVQLVWLPRPQSSWSSFSSALLHCFLSMPSRGTDVHPCIWIRLPPSWQKHRAIFTRGYRFILIKLTAPELIYYQGEECRYSAYSYDSSCFPAGRSAITVRPIFVIIVSLVKGMVKYKGSHGLVVAGCPALGPKWEKPSTERNLNFVWFEVST